jgi:hypothetical protein
MFLHKDYGTKSEVHMLVRKTLRLHYGEKIAIAPNLLKVASCDLSLHNVLVDHVSKMSSALLCAPVVRKKKKGLRTGSYVEHILLSVVLSCFHLKMLPGLLEKCFLVDYDNPVYPTGLFLF